MGFARPVLPAAVAEDAHRFCGRRWYFPLCRLVALAPFLSTACLQSFASPIRGRRGHLAGLVVSWLVIASARAAEMLRTIPLPQPCLSLMALLAGWSIDWALSHRDPWLWRWIAVEVIFVGFFTNWYFSRYFHLWQRLQFWQMALWIVGLSGFVLVGGWVWDRFRAGKPGVSQPDRIDHQERNSLRTK